MYSPATALESPEDARVPFRRQRPLLATLKAHPTQLVRVDGPAAGSAVPRQANVRSKGRLGTSVLKCLGPEIF